MKTVTIEVFNNVEESKYELKRNGKTVLAFHYDSFDSKLEARKMCKASAADELYMHRGIEYTTKLIYTI